MRRAGRQLLQQLACTSSGARPPAGAFAAAASKVVDAAAAWTSCAQTRQASHLHTATVPTAEAQTGQVHALGDPFQLVNAEAAAVTERLRLSVASTVPALEDAARYFFQPAVLGKQLRPKLSLLMSSALAAAAPPSDCLAVDLRPAKEHAPELRRRQQRIAEITELIHVASLLHDDVIDEASTRRGISSLNAMVGNKRAILAGDFLLARASVSLAALDNSEVVMLMSEVLENLVAGEIMQLTASPEQLLDVNFYLQKSYCKTAALMANSLKSVAVLCEQPKQVAEVCWSYGRHLGLAFQIVDDILDLTQASSVLGKPSNNDVASGIATVPWLFAAEERQELRPIIMRRFKGPSDINDALEMIATTSGIARARELALKHCYLAADMLNKLPPAQSAHAAESRAALAQITHKVLTRKS